MLVLRRRKNESILIGDDIRITILETAGDGVRLAIDAPRNISILREELSHAEEVNRGSVSSGKLTEVLSLQKDLLSVLGGAQKDSE